MFRRAVLKWQQSRVGHLCSPCLGGQRCSSRLQSFKESPFGTLTSHTHPRVPLCERPATWTSTKAEVSSWYQEALDRLSDIGDSLNTDGGPLRDELDTELQWMMEDAVVGWNEKGHASSFEGTQELVKMRISLHELGDLWDRRINERVPLQYLTCSAFWRDMVVSVGPGVLIPRPETELMVDFVIDAVSRNLNLALNDWADIGTGSGALAVALAREMPQCPTVYAADIAAEPLKFATFNAIRYNVENRVKVIESNWYEGLKHAGVGSLAGIVSNPPYIVSDTIATLQAEVAMHEPLTALDGGDDLAIDSLMPICKGASEMLQSGGFLALETAGGEQAHYMSHVLKSLTTFDDIVIRKDLRGIDRFVTASRR